MYHIIQRVVSRVSRVSVGQSAYPSTTHLRSILISNQASILARLSIINVCGLNSKAESTNTFEEAFPMFR